MRLFINKMLGASAFVLGLAAAGAGQAADLPRNNSFSSTPVFASNWAGFYAGAHLGYSFGRSRSADMDGFKGGLQVGHNWQTDRFVYGLEGDLAYAGIDYRGFTESFRQKWLSTGRARLGYSFDRVLPFVTGGIAYSSATMKAGGAKETNGHFGYVIGVGAEMMLTDKVSASVQYLHYRFNSQTYSVVPARNANIINNEVRVGLNYRF